MYSLLLLAALLPAGILLLQVYRLDRIEKEPSALLGTLAAAGAVCGFIAAAAEWLLRMLLGMMIREESLWRLVLENFLVIALVEEFCKRLPVMKYAWKSSAFDYRFDAVVYCVFSALGFAALENVFYVAQLGLFAALTRALLSIPGHFFFAVYMGVYLGEAKQAERDGEGFEMDRAMRASLFVPTLLHGFWDFCLHFQTLRMTVVFYVFVLVFFLLASQKLTYASRTDHRI